MFEEITDPIFGAFDSAVCFVSDVMADTTGFRCTRTGTGILPFGAPQRQSVRRQPVRRQPVHRQPAQRVPVRRTAPRGVPTPPPAQRRVSPARAGFKMITRG